jgi:hypothetical protein
MSDYQVIKQLHHEIKELADEIERLRLTDEEREAIMAVTRNYQRLCDEYGPSDDDDSILATIRRLLERTR